MHGITTEWAHHPSIHCINTKWEHYYSSLPNENITISFITTEFVHSLLNKCIFLMPCATDSLQTHSNLKMCDAVSVGFQLQCNIERRTHSPSVILKDAHIHPVWYWKTYIQICFFNHCGEEMHNVQMDIFSETLTAQQVPVKRWMMKEFAHHQVIYLLQQTVETSKHSVWTLMGNVEISEYHIASHMTVWLVVENTGTP